MVGFTPPQVETCGYLLRPLAGSGGVASLKRIRFHSLKSCLFVPKGRTREALDFSPWLRLHLTASGRDRWLLLGKGPGQVGDDVLGAFDS